MEPPVHLVYLLVDVSFSTTDRFGATTGIDHTNEAIRQLVERLYGDQRLTREVWLCVIDFADESHVVVPLSGVQRLHDGGVPALSARGGTSYAQAFCTARNRMAADLAQLRADGFVPERPTVVFLTDGDPIEPDREWQDAFASLTSMDGAQPRIWPVGYGAANPLLLDRLVAPPGWRRPLILDADDVGSLGFLVHELLLDATRNAIPTVPADGEEGRPFVEADPDELRWDLADEPTVG